MVSDPTGLKSSRAQSESRGDRVVRWLLAVLLLATVAAYLPAIRAPFEFDDASAITSNASLRSLSPTVALRPPENTSVSGRPVVNYTFAINAAINRWLGVDERPGPFGRN